MAEELIHYSGPIVSVDFARANRLLRYFTGRPCKSGHVSERQVANNTCMACVSIRKRKWGKEYRKTPEAKAKRNARIREFRAISRAKTLGEAIETPIIDRGLRSPRKVRGDRLLKHRASRYGLTLKELKNLFESQDGKCWICREVFPLSGKNCLHIDHCHETNVVRGLLCVVCNRGIGYFRDSPVLFMRAAAYLKTVGFRVPLEKTNGKKPDQENFRDEATASESDARRQIHDGSHQDWRQ